MIIVLCSQFFGACVQVVMVSCRDRYVWSSEEEIFWSLIVLVYNFSFVIYFE